VIRQGDAESPGSDGASPFPIVLVLEIDLRSWR
jgi:hypothetical protein